MDSHLRQSLRTAFDAYDQDGNGSLCPAELKQVLLQSLAECNVDVAINDDDVQQCFQHMDLDKNGKIDFEEFVKLCEDVLVEAHNDADADE